MLASHFGVWLRLEVASHCLNMELFLEMLTQQPLLQLSLSQVIQSSSPQVILDKVDAKVLLEFAVTSGLVNDEKNIICKIVCLN